MGAGGREKAKIESVDKGTKVPRSELVTWLQNSQTFKEWSNGRLRVDVLDLSLSVVAETEKSQATRGRYRLSIPKTCTEEQCINYLILLGSLAVLNAIQMDGALVLDVFGQSPSLQIYTQLCFCFALPDHDREFSDTDAVVVGMLSEALQRLTTSFPWLAGQVVNENSGAGIQASSWSTIRQPPRLVVRDLRKNSSADPKIPAIEVEHRYQRWPLSDAHTLIAPRNTVPGTYGESDISVSPVFLVQATFIEGGLILTFVAQHATMDMIGQGHIIRLFDKACRKEDFTAEELAAGNVARQNIVPLLDDSFEPGAEVAHQIVAEKPIPDTLAHGAASPPPSFWAYFMFNPTELAALKSLAIKTLPSSSSFVSTDDALTPSYGNHRARAPPRLSPTTTNAGPRHRSTLLPRHPLYLPGRRTEHDVSQVHRSAARGRTTRPCCRAPALSPRLIELPLPNSSISNSPRPCKRQELRLRLGDSRPLHGHHAQLVGEGGLLPP
ncbi:Cytoplasmic and mitochondrial histidine tRNA synthetase [Salix suchowensis]|nr:Cytoplasmic and mitochondrial histidine tRNA synthetase [Salix suchowensis]